MGVDLLIPRNRNDDAGAATHIGFVSLFPFLGCPPFLFLLPPAAEIRRETSRGSRRRFPRSSRDESVSGERTFAPNERRLDPRIRVPSSRFERRAKALRGRRVRDYDRSRNGEPRDLNSARSSNECSTANVSVRKCEFRILLAVTNVAVVGGINHVQDATSRFPPLPFYL